MGRSVGPDADRVNYRDAMAKSCTYKASTQSGQQTCQAEGGYYDPAADYCELETDPTLIHEGSL